MAGPVRNPPRRGEKARANETLPGIQADSLGGGGLLRNEQPDPLALVPATDAEVQQL